MNEEIANNRKAQSEVMNQAFKEFELLPDNEKLKTLLTLIMSLQFSTVENSATLSALIKTMTDSDEEFLNKLLISLNFINENLASELQAEKENAGL